MEHLEELISEKTKGYPIINWGKLEEEHGLANILFVLIERNPNIWQKLYPQYSTTSHHRQPQCGELAKILFTNIPEIHIHLRNRHGLKHYAMSIHMRLRRWEESFIKVLHTMHPNSNWPNQDKIKLLCPSFARLAPLFWGFMKNCKKFANVAFSTPIEYVRLEFCKEITVYNPQHAVAQVAAQDAVLRKLRDPPRSFVSSTPKSASRNRLPSPRQGSTALHSDIAVLSDQQTPRHYESQARSGAFQPPQRDKTAQQIKIGNLDKGPDRLDKYQLGEMESLLDEREPQANRVHQLELEIMELKGKTTELERNVSELMEEKRRRCFSQQDQPDAADKVRSAEKQRRYERFAEQNPQTPEKTMHSSSKRKFHEAFWYLNSDREDTEDNPITPTDAMSPQTYHTPLAATDFYQPDIQEEFRSWHPPSLLNPTAWPPQGSSHVFSSELFVARLKKEAFLRQRPAPPASPHQDEHEFARGFPRTRVHNKGRTFGSAHLPQPQEEYVTEFSTWEDLDKERLRTWRAGVESVPHIRPDLDTVVKDEGGSNDTIGFIKEESI